LSLENRAAGKANKLYWTEVPWNPKCWVERWT